MQEQLKPRNPELGLKIALIAFLCTAAGAGLSFLSERLGWLVMAISMFGVFVGIGIHWWLNWRRILHVDE
jgi:hypothetical protein